jgi:Ankyrin repeats (3 copies)
MFAEAVAAIDNGDLGALRALLAERPELLTERLENGREDYFARPYLLWFVAENPIRTGSLPPNIARLARAILDAAERQCPATLAEQRDYALALVCSGRVPRESGVQIELIDALVEAGADPNCLETALAHRENVAADRLLEHGATVTPLAAVYLDREIPEMSGEERALAFAGAALHGKPEALRHLIAAGADVNAYSPEGMHPHATALHHAVDSGSLEAVQVLIEAGADPTIRDRVYDGTARDWADHLGRNEIAAYLAHR